MRPPSGGKVTEPIGSTNGTTNDGDILEKKEAKPKSKLNLTPSFPEFLGQWDPSYRCDSYVAMKDVFQPATLADPEKPNLLKSGVTLKRLTPRFGSIVEGVQLSSLQEEGKNELALLAVERGVLVFPNQDFANLGPEAMVEYAKHFGKLHIFPCAEFPPGFPEIHPFYRGPVDPQESDTYVHGHSGVGYGSKRVSERPDGVPLRDKPRPPPSLSTLAWHSDGSFEVNPPSLMFLIILDLPDIENEYVGGDTIFCDQVQAYERLSPAFQKFLDGLYAVHSVFERSANAIEAGGYVYRDPVAVVHPVVRVHPITGAKAVYVNEVYTRHIVGLKKEESEDILKFLYNHTAKGADMQARIKWEKGMVVVWDNGFSSHSGLTDFEGSQRHIVRVGPMGEQPIPVEA